ncbi:MAG: ATP-binding protein [Planctomycetaceae bacterium]
MTKRKTWQQSHQLDRLLTQRDQRDRLIRDELGDLSFCRTGAELPFQLIAERYERSSLLIIGNLAIAAWGMVFHGERMTAAQRERPAHQRHIFERNGESVRFRDSIRSRRSNGRTVANNEPSAAASID